MKRDSFEVTINNFEWLNQNELPLHAYLPPKPCAVSSAFGSPACRLPWAAASSSALPPPAQQHATGLSQLCPSFFSHDAERARLGKAGLEQHELPLCVCNGGPLCPGQLMGTRTCQGLHPPPSAAATALEPAGALRSPAAPASPAPRPALGSCLERQAGGGSDSRALGCSSSCCSLTGFPLPVA